MSSITFPVSRQVFLPRADPCRSLQIGVYEAAVKDKPFVLTGSSLEDLRAFPADARRRSTGNVFEDLGFPQQEAENLRIRADLMIRLRKIIEDRGLTQAAAATLLGVTQPRISDLVHGKIERFSVDTLISMLGRAGLVVKVTATNRRRVA
ncbi:MAG: XRE family transcriptional regulator [Polyangiaceae bacterium]|nr:XRE family transcriptional regulator [Polyangiaceae bacterium]